MLFQSSVPALTSFPWSLRLLPQMKRVSDECGIKTAVDKGNEGGEERRTILESRLLVSS